MNNHLYSDKNRISIVPWTLFIIFCIFCGFYYSYIVLLGLMAGVIFIWKHQDYNDVLCLLISLFPFAEIFKIPLVSTSMFTVLEIFFVILWFLYEKKISRTCIFTVIIYLTYCFCGSIISGNIGIIDLLKLFMNIMLLYIFIDSYEPENYHKCVFYYEFGLVAASIIGLFKVDIPGFAAMYSDLNISWINGVYVTRFSATFNDPNYYTIAVVVALAMAISLMAGNDRMSVDTMILGIVLLVFGCTTYSKSFYLMVAVLGIFTLLVLLRKGKIGWLLFTVLIVAILISTGALSSNEMIQTVLSRFNGASTDDMSSLTTGRWDIWEDYMSYIFSNLRITLFGDGIGASYYLGRAMHNIYVEMWYYVGFIGMVGYLIMIAIFLFQRSLVRRKSVLNYFLIIAVAVLYFFLAGFTAFEFPYYMMMCWLVLNTDFSKWNINRQLAESDTGNA